MSQLVAKLARDRAEERRDAADGFLDYISQYSEAEAERVGRALLQAAQLEHDAGVQESIANALAELAVNSRLSPDLVMLAADIPVLDDRNVEEQLEYLREKAAGFSRGGEVTVAAGSSDTHRFGPSPVVAAEDRTGLRASEQRLGSAEPKEIP
ncbi:hypothetical protein GC722_00395 [Auraticoccus sp. F435]|uniref:Uncharacterized protein n=1 Tax=Auraticoccus cholistanensis TaxID=2656650 RepID=A0A6A9UPA3_9ACTN|nr:hypothetical protein [Auraticoccus cholistanensis]MVA74501.1 hypothetical protein [Auraticoccus cholistanensis]